MGDFDSFSNDIGSALGIIPPTVSNLPANKQAGAFNKYADIDAQYDKKYGLPVGTLNTFSKIESNHNERAYNDKNRNGTADSGRFQVNSANSGIDGNNPDQVGQFVSKLYKQYNGDLGKVAAAYNVGPNGNFESPVAKTYVNRFNTAFNSQGSAPAGTAESQSDIGGGFNATDIEKALNAPEVRPEVTPGTTPQNIAMQLESKFALDKMDSRFSAEKIEKGLDLLSLPSAETAVQMATGLGASVYGGLKSLGSLAMGKGLDQAASNVREAQEKYTYQPRTAGGKQLADTGALLFSGLKAGTGNVGGTIGQAVGGDKGRAAGESIGQVVPDIAMVLAGGRSLIGSKSVPLSDVATTRVEPAVTATKPRYKLNSDGSMARVESTPAVPDYASGAKMDAAPTAVEQAKSVIQKDNPNLTAVELQRHAEAQTLPVPVQLTKGQGSGDVNLISIEQNSKGANANIAQTLNAQNTALIDNFSAIRNKVAPDVSVSGADLGQNIVDAYKAKDAPIVADISAKYKALEDANGGNFPLDGKAFVTNTEAALDKALKSGSVPADIQSSLNAFKNGRQMTFQDFETLRSDLADVSRSSADGRQRAAANIVRKQLEEMPLTREAAGLKPLADQARQAAAARFDRIKTDPAYKAAINDGVPVGEPSPVADKFVKNYLVNGQAANVKNMVANIGDSPANVQLMKAGIIDHLKARSGIDLRTNTGNVSQSGLNKAIQEQGNKLPMLLGEDASTVNTLGNVARYTQEQPKGSSVNNSNTFTAALGYAKDASKAVLNAKTGGLSGMAENLFSGAKRQKELNSLAAPVKLRDLGK